MHLPILFSFQILAITMVPVHFRQQVDIMFSLRITLRRIKITLTILQDQTTFEVQMNFLYYLYNHYNFVKTTVVFFIPL